MKDKIRVDAGGYLHVQSDHIKCACFLISSATVHFTRNPSVVLDTVATHSHIYTPHSVVLDTQWLHTAKSTRHILWC
jgi:hypothetical protein